MSQQLALDQRIDRLRKTFANRSDTDPLVESFSWESFLTQYNQLDVEIHDELEDFQLIENRDRELEFAGT